MAASTSKNILVGFSGSVATVKCFQLLEQLSEHGQVAAVFTESAWAFFEAAKKYDPKGYERISSRLHLMWELYPDSLPPLPAPSADQAAPPIHVYRDSNEWAHYTAVGKDPVIHIELRKWAHVLLVAPCSANTLAKVAGGLADNLLTCVARAWEVGTRPFLLAPAMNTAMWAHPLTAQHLAVATDTLQATVIPPKASTKLACGDVGGGALAAVGDIVAATTAALD